MNIREVREKANITQREAAELLGCSENAYGRYERGDRDPSIEMLKKMSRIFNVTIDYLVGNSFMQYSVVLSDSEKALIEIARQADERAVNDATLLLQSHCASN